MTIESRKELFALPEGVHYLNCAYMGPLSRRVADAGLAAIRRARDPSGLAASEFFEASDRVRVLFGRLVNAPAERIAIIPAVSYGVGVVASNVACRRGQNVVVTAEQFPSNVYGWRELCRGRGLELRTVEPPSEPGARGRRWNERLLEAIDGDTAVVAVPNVHWTDGTLFELSRIAERARACGAALVVDGTQSVGALPVDVQQVRPDALICAGYKWLLGPYSIGLAYLGPRFDGGRPLEETWIGRAGSDDFQALVHYRDEYQSGAARYDVGERSNFILMPMLLAALEQRLEWGAGAVLEHCRALTGGLIDEARALGFALEADEWRAPHLFGLRVPARVDLAAVQARLQARRVLVSLRGSALRVSPNVYNDEADVAALAEVLRQVHR